MKQQQRSRSELVRDALLRYMEECEWRELFQYGKQRAKTLRGDKTIQDPPILQIRRILRASLVNDELFFLTLSRGKEPPRAPSSLPANAFRVAATASCDAGPSPTRDGVSNLVHVTHVR